jgi:HK97 family phage major capsid protein
MEDIKNITKAIEEKLDSVMQKFDAEKASKADVQEINKTVMNLQASLAAQGEDASEPAKRFQGVTTKKFQKKYLNSVYNLMEQTGILKSLGVNAAQNDEIVKNFGITKATNVSEYDAAGAAGMLQTVVDEVIHKVVPLYGVARQECRVVSGIRGSFKCNTLSTLPNFGFTNTGGTIRDDATLTAHAQAYATPVTITPAQVYGLVKIPEKTIYDAIPGVVADTAEDLAWSAGLFEDQMLFKGDGTATFNGFTGLSSATIGYGNKTIAVRTGSFTNFDPLLQCRLAVAPGASKSGAAKYHMHPFTFAYLQTLKASTSGTYHYDIATNEWKLSGTVIVLNQVMDTVNASNLFDIGAVPVIFGDLSKAVTVGLGRDQNLRTLLERYADTTEIALRLTYDLAMGINIPSLVTRVSVVS